MRPSPAILVLACVAALAATGVQAQSRPSLADRVAALEARDQSQGQQNVDLLNRISQLEADVKDLRSLVEQLQHDNQQAADRAKAQYMDIDSRLSHLEGSGQASTPAATPASAPAATSARPPPVAAPPPPSANGGDEAAYKAAFDAMRGEHYADSASQFNAFVQQYPDSPLVPNAWYWMGESYYVTQNYQFALKAFQTLVDRYPGSAKAVGALLKIGYCQDGLRQREAARATLRQVIAKYPGSDEANQAQGRLRAMAMEAGG